MTNAARIAADQSQTNNSIFGRELPDPLQKFQILLKMIGRSNKQMRNQSSQSSSFF